MPKVQVDRTDSRYAILTDTLPYEVPIVFSNEGFFNVLKEKNLSKLAKEFFSLESNKKRDFEPYSFQIRKNNTSTRTLAIPHPVIQQEYSKFYNKYGELIISLCARSEFSLRHPHTIALAYFDKDYGVKCNEFGENVEESCVGSMAQQRHGSSYFTYRKFNLQSKFYESFEFHRLEKRFSLLRICDISKCFPSIYTHTISWAVKSREYAKQNRTVASFESSLDKLMMRSNSLETHGIIVGPEFSRVFAEIILQRIDCNIQNELAGKSLFHNKHYAIRRYVDDYFIFCSSEHDSLTILSVISDKLEEYKLFLNDSKNEVMPRPFSSSNSVAKFKIFDFITTAFNIIWHASFSKYDASSTVSPDIHVSLKHSRLSNIIIERFKAIIFESKIDFTQVSKSSFLAIRGQFKKRLSKMKAVIRDGATEASILKAIFAQLDLIFFIYSLDINVRTTYITAQIILMIEKFSKLLHKRTQAELLKRIFDEFKLIISSANAGQQSVPIELANLIIASQRFIGQNNVNEKHLLSALRLGYLNGTAPATCNQPDYFSTITLLAFIRDDSKYDKIRMSLAKAIQLRYKSSPRISSSTELSCMIFDIVSCPFLSVSMRKDILSTAMQCHYGTKIDAMLLNTEFNYISRRTWFTDWDIDINITNALKKKELRTPY